MKASFLLEEIVSAQEEYQRELKAGVFSPTLQKRIEEIEEKEDELLFSYLPLFRHQRIQDSANEAVAKLILKDVRDYKESSLDSQMKERIHSLLEEETKEETLPFEEERIQGLGEMYFLLKSSETCFLFNEDGKVFLAEKNMNWEIQRKPILEECYVKNALLIDDKDFLILNEDEAVELVSYPRIETVKEMKKVNLYG